MRVLGLARSNGGAISEVDVGQALRVAVPLAREFIRLAEAKGYLCRDETVYSLRFYENRFLDRVALITC